VSIERTLAELRGIAADFAAARAERQRRRHLDTADFRRIADAGFLRSGLPVADGGYWQDAARSSRSICELLRTLAHGDPSVALVCSMHPSVLTVWLHLADAPAPFTEAWRRQRAEVFETVKQGHWWGTVTSEPGSGGDMFRTRATAEPTADGGYRISGDKHFASGSGIATYMITTAKPAGEDAPDLFVLDLRNAAWDGSQGMKLVGEWDGHGMAATQSHAFRFAGFPAKRNAWPGNFQHIGVLVATFGAAAFSAVIVGVVETAIAAARAQLAAKHASLRAYEQVEWTRVETEGWLVEQAYEGMLRAIESSDAAGAYGAGLRGKVAIAELSESLMLRLCKVIGGGTFSQSSPFGNWAEDVRALGFLRPPWGLAYDSLFANALG
jgi:alkylation response protein AidB-like acyl-CoA dehydrogenase